jgi:hypothetical protein
MQHTTRRSHNSQSGSTHYKHTKIYDLYFSKVNKYFENLKARNILLNDAIAELARIEDLPKPTVEKIAYEMYHQNKLPKHITTSRDSRGTIKLVCMCH